MIKWRINDIDKLRKEFGDMPIEKALRSTINKMAAKAKTAVSKEIRKTYNIKARDLNAQMRIDKYKPSRHSAILIASGPRFSLMYFDPVETTIRGSDAILTKRSTGKNASYGLVSRKVRRGKKKRGVTVKVRKDRGRKRVVGKKGYGGFIAQGRRGGIGGGGARALFNKSAAKQGRGNVQIFMREGEDRLPIEKLTGPAVAQMLSKSKDAFFKSVSSESERIFANELDYFTRQSGVNGV